YSLRYIRDRKGSGDIYLTMEPSLKSQQRFRDRIKELTGAQRSWLPVEELLADINRYQNGWRAYFKRGYPARVFGKLNYHTSERVIRHLRRRSQRPYRFDDDRSYYAQLKELGLQRL
ncbi:group II intron maturase-specific domain-containing protein, partial [Arthrospira platensis SPKY2]